MPRVSQIETPEEMRAQGRHYLALAESADDPAVAETLRQRAHVAFEMAALLERGGTMPATH
jgi:hypothetical protein